ncbi:N/A [soil metagenome]
MRPGAHVLIVDDDPDHIKLCRIVLGDAGYQITSAGDAETALGMIEAQCPDVILSDLDLPAMSGFELARKLKADARFRAVPMIAISATYGVKSYALRFGFIACLAKPLAYDTLADQLGAILA